MGDAVRPLPGRAGHGWGFVMGGTAQWGSWTSPDYVGTVRVAGGGGGPGGHHVPLPAPPSGWHAVACTAPELPAALHGLRWLHYATREEARDAACRLAAENACEFVVYAPVIRAALVVEDMAAEAGK